MPRAVTLRDGTPCLLRSPRAADAGAILEYRKLASAETHFMLRNPEEITMTVGEEEAYLERVGAAAGEVSVSAFVDGELAGDASVRPVGTLAKLRHRAEFGIAVKRKFWGRGIGGLLLAETLAEARRMGYAQMELSVFADNARARALYERFGFAVWGTVKNAYKLRDGTCVDELIMGVVFDAAGESPRAV